MQNKDKQKSGITESLLTTENENALNFADMTSASSEVALPL